MSSERAAKRHAQAHRRPRLVKQAERQAATGSADQQDTLVALRDFGASLLQALTLDAIFETTGQQLATIMPHDGGFILIRSTLAPRLQQFTFGALTLPAIDEERLQVNGGLVARVYTNGQLGTAHGTNTPDLAFWERQLIAEDQSLLCVPLMLAQRCAGVLGLRGPLGTHFGDAACTLLSALAAPLSLALERAQQHTMMTRHAQTTKIDGMRRLTSTIGHELRNPLQGLQGSLQLLLNTALLSTKRDLVLQKAQSEVNQLITTVQRMLECYTPAYEDMRPVSLPMLIERVLALVAGQLQERQIVVERDWEAALPRVRGVEGHLKQALLSLFLNAIEAMPAGGQLHIHARVAERPADQMQMVEIDVIDTGAGIAPDHVFAIFEPFYSTKANQAGLGLVISYSIIDRHAGALRVSSGELGATFSISLPAY